MKTQIKLLFVYSAISVATLLLLFCTSCRSESEELTQADEEQILQAESEVANLMFRIALNDGSNDNIIDDSSCFNIELPFTVNVNGADIIIDAEDDFEIIEDIFDEFEDDLDDIDFIFPITIIMSDFSEVIIENEDQLEDLIEDCDDENDDDDDDIECIDFQYPFSVSVFNENSELIETITFNNDEELFNFIRDLTIEDIVNINFPISVIFADETELTINNLEELEEVIKDSIEDCEENDLSSEDFVETLIEKPLEVQKYKDDQNNETDNYDDYLFDFFEDGTVTITNDDDDNDDDDSDGQTITTQGTWSVATRADGGLDVTFDFGDEAPLDKLSTEWNVKKVKEERIMLTNYDSDISKDELFFEQE